MIGNGSVSIRKHVLRIRRPEDEDSANNTEAETVLNGRTAAAVLVML